MSTATEEQVSKPAPSWPVIIHQSMAGTEYANILRQKQLKVRLSEGVVPGCFIFPLSGVAFLIVPLSQATYTDQDTQCLQLTEELIGRLDKFIQVHRKCYMLCQAPLHGPSERQVFSLIQSKYLDTPLNLLPVHSAGEAVKTMMTIGKALCKPVSETLWDRLDSVVQQTHHIDYTTNSLKQLGLTSHQCQVIADGLGSLSKLSTATRDDLLDCSLDTETVTHIMAFFNPTRIGVGRYK